MPLLRTRSDSFQADLAGVLVPNVYFAADIIFEEGMMGTHVFFISSGLIEIRVSFIPDPKSRYGGVMTAIGNGCYFGDVALLLRQADGKPLRRTATTQAHEACSVCMLYAATEGSISRILADYPKALSHMRKVARARLARARLFNPLRSHHVGDRCV